MTSINLLAVGDLMLGEHPLSIGRGVGSTIDRNGVDYIFSDVADVFGMASITFGNLEAVLSNYRPKERNLRSVSMIAAPRSAEGLARAGFRVLSIANNHIFDHGREAARETVEYLKRNGIEAVGLDDSLKPQRDALVVECDHIKVAFLAYCMTLEWGQQSVTPSSDQMSADVVRARERADVVIVSMHWGDEYIERPSPLQMKLARMMIDSGADVILGHHPHVLQAVEKYRHGVIAYSLGNFVFDLNYYDLTRDSIVLECHLTEKGVDSHRLIPVRIDAGYVPRFLSGDERKIVLERLERLSRELERAAVDDEDEARRYAADVQEARRNMRKRMIGYLLRNITKYPVRFTCEMTLGFAVKRFRRMHS